jgi:hypothetical protein
MALAARHTYVAVAGYVLDLAECLLWRVHRMSLFDYVIQASEDFAGVLLWRPRHICRYQPLEAARNGEKSKSAYNRRWQGS